MPQAILWPLVLEQVTDTASLKMHCVLVNQMALPNAKKDRKTWTHKLTFPCISRPKTRNVLLTANKNACSWKQTIEITVEKQIFVLISVCFKQQVFQVFIYITMYCAVLQKQENKDSMTRCQYIVDEGFESIFLLAKLQNILNSQRAL